MKEDHRQRPTVSQPSINSNNSDSRGMENGITPGIDMPSQPIHRDFINVGVDSKIGVAAKIDLIERNKHGGRPREFNVRAEADPLALRQLGLGWRAEILGIDRRAEDAIAVLWVRDPTYGR